MSKDNRIDKKFIIKSADPIMSSIIDDFFSKFGPCNVIFDGNVYIIEYEDIRDSDDANDHLHRGYGSIPSEIRAFYCDGPEICNEHPEDEESVED
jgi:hypothetical protein